MLSFTNILMLAYTSNTLQIISIVCFITLVLSKL